MWKEVCQVVNQFSASPCTRHGNVTHLSHPMRPPSPSIPEKEFLYDSLKQSLRLDGRKPLELRNVTISFGPELGWVECALGDTKYEKSEKLIYDIY